ncbi:D-amino-acid transaminase [Vibrio algarum]|uniref:branched-chain-amino-acid transaminase n=1 Tax=Vibrio algarum TaxID=3020714 RepID=A0ABT4YUY8_9VIBR|nr:D-amino-acid transaminase [Vibrio sp. KJ40-1]MDB1125405.1 D-amino-acid transaminase [Vibrio sp. KJ40-1]
MPRTVYLNGEYLPESEAKVSIFDRGFLFADAIYEVTAVVDGKLLDNDGHVARLARSCGELEMKNPLTAEELVHIQKELVRLNDVKEGGIYLQVTRGSSGDRDFAYPENTEPTVVLFSQSRAVVDSPKAKKGIKVISTPDIRWRRRDIKTTSLLAACMAKQAAIAAGCDDVWLIEDGYVTEGGSSNAYIITQDNVIVTRPLSNDILHGITRASLLKVAKQENLVIEERLFTIEEAYAAKEAFISSASTFVWPVVAIDDKPIGSGSPGPIAMQIRETYIEFALAQAV